MTALDLISSSLRLIGVLAAGEAADIATANDALSVFNDMVDSWNTERLAIFTTSATDFPLVLGKQSYTLGTGGDFDMARPAQIDGISAILLTNPSVPVEIPMLMYSVDQWQNQVPVKNVLGSFPQICYDDGGFPLRTLNFWSIPNQQNDVRIYAWQALSQAASLATTIAFPPGYNRAFRYNLAVDLSAEFNAPLPPAVAAIAVDSLAKVKTINSPDLTLQSDIVPSPAGYNYKADLFGIPF